MFVSVICELCGFVESRVSVLGVIGIRGRAWCSFGDICDERSGSIQE